MEVCCVCEKEYKMVWTAPDEIWRKLNGGNDGGLICIGCFDKLARKHGIVLYWECAAGSYPIYPCNVKNRFDK